MSKSNTKFDSVRPSRDGDQFHYLWAARRCLLLLSSYDYLAEITRQNGLVAISIEGCSPSESYSDSTSEEGVQVIDVAEYFGNENLNDATQVRYIQLKHSTRNPSRDWTASGLKSMLNGFVDRYKDLSDQINADDLAHRFEFRFVTNRPVSKRIKDSITDATRESVPRHPQEFNRLLKITGLNQSEFTKFARLLKFEDCQGNYLAQRHSLFDDVHGYLPGVDHEASTQLKELVTRKALSESSDNPVIRKLDVLNALQTDEDALFPAPNEIQLTNNPIPRYQENFLVDEIMQAENKPVIIHALAGVGKSTFSMRIPALLPPGSVSVVYDCFGNGGYRNASSFRHRHKDGLVQISNELAAKSLCHLLIPSARADNSDYVRAFLHRLRQSIELVRAANSNAILCIVVDAADNAQSVAKENNEAFSFPRHLIREELPTGVRLVYFCRSHRISILDPPTNALQIQLNAFSRSESAANLRRDFPQASEQDVGEFHSLSSQNPWMQFHVLSRFDSLHSIFKYLGPTPTNVDDEFKRLLSDAIKNLKDKCTPAERVNLDSICIGIATLRPRIPLHVLSQISNVSVSAIRSFVLELGESLLISNDSDTIQFRDESSETWFQEQFKPSSEQLQNLIEQLKPLSRQNVYAASILPEIMLKAGQYDELVNMALSSSALPEISELENNHVELQRLQFALKSSLRQKQYLDAAKLALKAGDVMAGSTRQINLIQENTDLAAEFIDKDVIQDIVTRREFDSDWLFLRFVYEACLLSGVKNSLAEARSRLRIAEQLVNHWSSLSTEEREQNSLSTADIAEMSLAHLNIHGIESAVKFIGRWTPQKASFGIGKELAIRLVDHARFTELDELAIAAKENVWLILAITLELNKVQKTPPSTVVSQTIESTEFLSIDENSSNQRNISQHAHEVAIVIEAASKLSLSSSDKLVALLDRFLPAVPPKHFSLRYNDKNACIELLRLYCLRAELSNEEISLIDLAHPELRVQFDKDDEYKWSRESREFKSDIGAVLPWNKLWAEALLRRVPKESLADKIEQLLNLCESTDWRSISGDNRQIFNHIVKIWFNILHCMNALEFEYLCSLDTWIKNRQDVFFIPTLTALARLASQNQTTTSFALSLAQLAFSKTRSVRTFLASEKADTYIEIARSVMSISKSEAKFYFDEAIQVCRKIDEENINRWDAIVYLAERGAQRNQFDPQIAYDFARCAELTQEHDVTDESVHWHSTVKALSSLCPYSSLAIASRWRDRGFGSVEKTLPTVIETLVERGDLDSHDALSMIGFNANWNYSTVLSSVLDACEDEHSKKSVSADVLRKMIFSGSSFYNWSEQENILANHNLLQSDLDEYIAYARNVSQKHETHYHENWQMEKLPPEALDEIFDSADLNSADGISGAFATFQNYPPPWNIDQFFAEAINRLPPGNESEFLIAIGTVPQFNFFHVKTILSQIPSAWCHRFPIKQALKSMIKAFCRRFHMEVSRDRYYERFPFDLAYELAELREEDIADIALEAMGECPDQPDKLRLFSLIGLLKSKLTAEEAFEALQFGLKYYDSDFEETDGDGAWSSYLIPPKCMEESIAGYIYAGLASPVAKIRWEAAHVVLGLCRHHRFKIIQYLISFCKSNDAGSFADNRLYFYKLHATQWLMIAFARAATEYSSVLKPIASDVVDLALRDQNHVMIRHFAAQTALVLIENGELNKDERIVERLTSVNLTSLPLICSISPELLGDHKIQHEESDEGRFLFDYDFKKYWLEPLRNVFGLTQRDIETKARDVIESDLKFKSEDPDIGDQRARKGLYVFDQTYATHGSYPSTDDLRHYLSYHAMMIVAGELLETTPVVNSDSPIGKDAFTEWLLAHQLTRTDGRWLADRRDLPPLDHLTWLGSTEDGSEVASIASQAFDQTLITGNAMNVWGNWSVVKSNCVQEIRVLSALVCRDKSLALLRALSSAEFVSHYRIPIADEVIKFEDLGFMFQGWIGIDREQSELEKKDFWSGGVMFPPPIPINDIVESMGLSADLDKRIWLDNRGNSVMVSHMWGGQETIGQEQYSEYLDSGNRLQASFEFVKELLAKFDIDMIIEVEIEIRKRNSRYQTENQNVREYPRTAKLYLVRPDGRITTI